MSRAAIVVPVRMVIGTRVLQTTTRALDPEGVFVRCVSPPLSGAKVTLRLYLPDGPPEDVHGAVVPETDLTEVGCRVEFDDLTDRQRERIQRLGAPPVLQRTAGKVPSVPPPFAGAAKVSGPGATLARLELRALPRVPLQIKVRFDSVEALAERLSADISAGGLFVHAAEPPLVGEEIQVLFSLPGDESPPLACRAVVVRRISKEEARFTGRFSGAGVQFLDASDSFRARLDAWLAGVQGLTAI